MTDDRYRITQEIQNVRRRQARRLAADYAEAAARLAAAYADARVAILEALDEFEDALSPGYPPGNDNDRAALERFVGLIGDDLQTFSQAVPEVLRDIETVAADKGIATGIANLRAGRMTVEFGRVAIDTMLAGIGYVDSPALALRIRDLSLYHADRVRNLLLAGIATAENPQITAQVIHRYFDAGRPLYDAERWARTVQAYAFREGTRRVYERSGVTEWIWSANLGNPRTCRACIAMHGTRHPVSEVLNDHHNGRCAMVPVTPTWEELGLTGTDPDYETGRQWFERQPDDEKQRILGPNLWTAYQSGLFNFTPETMTTTYPNEVFGEMRRPRTGEDILNRAMGAVLF